MNDSIKIKALVVIMMLITGVLSMSRQVAAEYGPTLQETMTWLADYAVRETGCTAEYDDSYTTKVDQLRYDADNQALVVVKRIRINSNPWEFSKYRIPLYDIDESELRLKDYNKTCFALMLYSKEGLYFFGEKDKSFDEMVNGTAGKWLGLGDFRSKSAANKALKVIRHAMKFSHKPKHKELF